MPRTARIIVPGLAHHVTQRGNYRQNVFEADRDRRVYLDLLRAGADRHDVRIWAWCLMENHVHLIAVPGAADSLARALSYAQSRYARWVHMKRGRMGHLWQCRYFSSPLDDAHLWAALRYVELNPVRAGIVKFPEDYRWSSAAHHVLGHHCRMVDPGCPVTAFEKDWKAFLAGAEDEREIERLRRATSSGKVAGSDEFIESLEVRLGRKDLRWRPQGRQSERTIPACPL